MNIHLSKQLLHWNSLYQQLNETYRQLCTLKERFLNYALAVVFFCENMGGSCE